jgi:tetratricopeptide (TPR) repeat protein
MPIAQSEQLFTIIKSLTKAEKRNFRLYVQRLQSNEDVLYVRLFDILDKAEEYDEKEVLEKMGDIPKPQFVNIKRHLYTQVLKSLRLIFENIESIKVREQIDFAHILYSKGLYLQAFKLLDRVKEMLPEGGHDLLRLEIIEFQKFIEERHITRSRKTQGKVESLLVESENQESRVSNLIMLSNLKIKIHGWYIQTGHVRDERDHFTVKEYFESELRKVRLNNLSVTEEIYLQQSYMWYYYILLDFERCFHHATLWVKAFDENPLHMIEDPVLYMRGLSYELTSLYSLRDYPRYVQTLEKFEGFIESHEKYFDMTGQIISFLYLYTAKINRHFLEGSFEEGLMLVPEINRLIKKFGRFIDVHRIMVFNYKTAWLYLGSGQPGPSIEYLNKILNLKSAGHLRTDIQCYARLMHLMAHFELGHFNLLEHLVDSVGRFFSKMRDLNEVQQLLFNFFKTNLDVRKQELNHNLHILKKEVIRLEKNPYEGRTFHHLDIVGWIDSRIEGKTVGEIIRNRFERAV